MSEQANQGRASLYKKIAAVTAAVSRIPKNGKNTFHNYAYATESDITDGLRDLLEQHGLAFLPPSVLEYERNATGQTTRSGAAQMLTRVRMQFELGCCETGEVYTSIIWGEGQDTDDKGFYKAYTGAVKYFLMKTFLIATGDDPERDDSPPEVKTTGKQAQQSAAKNGASHRDAPLCDVCGATGRLGKDGKSYYCPDKDAHNGKWYTITRKMEEADLPL